MTVHRFFIQRRAELIDKENIDDSIVTFSSEISHQIAKVLRLKKDECVFVLDNTGYEYVIELLEIHPKKVIGKIYSKKVNENESPVQLNLYTALIMKEKYELILQKCTEIGVNEFVPLITQRTQFNAQSVLSKKDRWEKILKEASEQSERGRIPSLNLPMKFKDALDQAIKHNQVLIAIERTPTTQPLNSLIAQSPTISLFIGPEGGFTPEEVEYARSKGATPISLGPRILRAETAAISAASLILLP